MKKYNFFKTDGKMPSQEQLLYTQLFYRNAPEIYAHFDEWKDNDRFYFIPLYLQMTYSCGWVAEVAPDPVWLGSFVRCTLEHPDLFQYQCPSCGKTVLPYRYAGSPLSGRIILGYSEFRGAWLGAKRRLGRRSPRSVRQFCLAARGKTPGRAFETIFSRSVNFGLREFVRVKGLEPLRLSAPDPKSGLATNYNTPADCCAKIRKN